MAPTAGLLTSPSNPLLAFFAGIAAVSKFVQENYGNVRFEVQDK